MQFRSGFSLMEVLVVVVLLGVLLTKGTMTYINYVSSLKQEVLSASFDEVETMVKDQIENINDGLSLMITDNMTASPVNMESTCAEFLDALKFQVQNLKNPFDGSPLVTFSTADRSKQKAGKVRITCYKVLHGTYDSGSQCKMSKAAIRVDTYKYSCGGACGGATCIFPNAQCAPDPGHPMPPRERFRKHESNKIYGKLQFKAANGKPDWNGAVADCRVRMSPRSIPKEADY